MKLRLLLLFSILYKINGQASIMCDLTSLNADDFHNGASDGNAGDCGDSLQEGDTCTPNCGTDWQVKVDASCGEVNGAIEFIPAVCESTICLNVNIEYTNGNVGDCDATMVAGATCSPECDEGYEATGGVNGQTKCNGGTNVNYAQCTDINECEETSGTIDYLSHPFTDGVCGDHAQCVNKDKSTDGVYFTCECDAGFDGTYCNNDIDECAGTPCYTGTCADGINSYTCTCLDGWTGDDCDTGMSCNNVHGPIANGNSNNCTNLLHDEYCRIQCNPGYYIIDGIGGNDLCWAGGFTGQSEFGNTYQNSSCAACPTGRYTTQLNSVTQCNTFSYYIDGSDRDGDAGQLCADGNHFIAGDSQTDSKCIQCSAGTYSTGGDVCQACPVGQQAQNSNNNNEYSSGGAYYCVACKDGSDNQDGGECEACPVGQYSVGGANCSVCGDGKQAQLSNVDHIFNNGSGSPYCVTCQDGYDHKCGICAKCKPCNEGEYSVGGAECTACPDGEQGQTVDAIDINSYASTGADRCITCQDGYQNIDGGQCEECESGKHSTAGNVCVRHTYYISGSDSSALGGEECVEGHDFIEGSTATNSQCNDCPTGTHSVDGIDCVTHTYYISGSDSSSLGGTLCGAGFEFIEGTDKTDSQCIECTGGQYSVNGDACAACPLGQYSTSAGTAVCDKCPLGTFMDMGTSLGQTNNINCLPCLSGSYGPTEGLHNSPDGGNPCTDCPLGSWSPTFDASDTGNPNYPNPPAAPEHCRDCPIHTYGASTGLTASSECSACADGHEALQPRTVTCTPCTAGTFALSGDACQTCPEGTFTLTEGQSECTAATDDCEDGYELIIGNAFTDSYCSECDPNTTYIPPGTLTCLPKTLDCIRGLQNVDSGTNLEDNRCEDNGSYEELDPEPYEIDHVYWQSQSDLCAFEGKFALLTQGRLVCVPCSYNLFKFEYEMSNTGMDVSNLPDNQKATRHGKCCYNTHHKVCQKMLEEYQRRCQTNEKGTGDIELQSCDIQPRSQGCPPYIVASDYVKMTTVDDQSYLLEKFNCGDGNGNENPDWVTMYGGIKYGTPGIYNLNIACEAKDHGGIVDAISKSIRIDIIDKVAETVDIHFDNTTHSVCSPDIPMVQFDQNHNVIEVTEEEYHSCDSSSGTVLHGYQSGGQDTVYELRTHYQKVRYFICGLYCNSGKKFKVTCNL